MDCADLEALAEKIARQLVPEHLYHDQHARGVLSALWHVRAETIAECNRAKLDKFADEMRREDEGRQT